MAIPFGSGHLTVDPPEGLQVQVVQAPPSTRAVDAVASIHRALEEPVAGPRLRELAGPNDRVVIVYTDATRSCPDELLVMAMLGELRRAGVSDRQVTLLCGVGLHRASTAAEKRAKLGPYLADHLRVVDHDARTSDGLVDLGTTDGGVPVVASRLVAEADLVLATGVVEPHQYAGYSGGRKTVAIGAAGEATIAQTHGPAFVEHPGTRLGVIHGNPFHAAIREAARRAGLRFILNVVLDEDGDLLHVAAGEPEPTFERLVADARRTFEVSIDAPFDAVVAGVGAPKDANLYQASRAASYLQLAPRPVVRPGGTIILPAPCPEGAGQGAGERRFLATLRRPEPTPALLQVLRQEGYPPGAQRAFVMAKVLDEVEVLVVGAEDPQLVRQCRMTPLADLRAAFAHVIARHGPQATVGIVPHALRTLPVVSTPPGA